MKYQHFTSTIFIVVLRTLSLQEWCIESRRKQEKFVWKSQNKFTITGCHGHYDLCILELLTAIWYVWLPGHNCFGSGCVNVSQLGVWHFVCLKLSVRAALIQHTFPRIRLCLWNFSSKNLKRKLSSTCQEGRKVIYLDTKMITIKLYKGGKKVNVIARKLKL